MSRKECEETGKKRINFGFNNTYICIYTHIAHMETKVTRHIIYSRRSKSTAKMTRNGAVFLFSFSPSRLDLGYDSSLSLAGVAVANAPPLPLLHEPQMSFLPPHLLAVYGSFRCNRLEPRTIRTRSMTPYRGNRSYQSSSSQLLYHLIGSILSIHGFLVRYLTHSSLRSYSRNLASLQNVKSSIRSRIA